MADLLRDTFRLNSWRTNQKEIINATLSNRDVFVVMRTGGGKSLCYQLPALLKGGITIGGLVFCGCDAYLVLLYVWVYGIIWLGMYRGLCICCAERLRGIQARFTEFVVIYCMSSLLLYY